jgi:hypothetical protein
LKKTPYKSTEENIGSFDINDPTSNVIDRIRCLVEHGPDQGMDADFRTSVSEDRRRFSLDWYSKKNCRMANQQNAICWFTKKLKISFFFVFCFCCILFGKVFQGKHVLPVTKED